MRKPAAAPATPEADPLAEAAAAALSEPALSAAQPVTWPIGEYVPPIAKLRLAGDPLSLVRHLIVPQPNGKATIGSFASARCGYTLMVDLKADDETRRSDLTLVCCGWCLRAAQGEQIPPYNKGARRPTLPDANLEAVRKQVPEPPKVQLAPDVEALLSDDAFNAAMAELQTSMQRMLSGDWQPDADELARLNTLTANTRAASEVRTERSKAAPTSVAPTRSRSEAAATPRGPRGPLFRVGKQTVDGEAATLPDIRLDGKLLGVLFRTFDPKGPFLLGDGTKRWTVRDIRSNTDVYFGKDKKGAVDYLDEQLARLTPAEREQGAAEARARMQANDPIHRRSR